jgi:hypothetical protein
MEVFAAESAAAERITAAHAFERAAQRGPLLARQSAFVVHGRQLGGRPRRVMTNSSPRSTAAT